MIASAHSPTLGFSIPIVSDAVNAASSALSSATKPLREIADTTIGRTILRAATTTLTGGLASIVGPQLATVAFAVPGVIRGEKFDEAWTKEFLWRVQTTAQILGPQIAGEMTAQLKDALGKINIEAPLGRTLNLPAIPSVSAATTPEALANKLGIREDVAAHALDATFRTDRYTAGATFDPRTGKRVTAKAALAPVRKLVATARTEAARAGARPPPARFPTWAKATIGALAIGAAVGAAYVALPTSTRAA